MAESLELRVSVTSVKRGDPYVKDILASATQVALYKFNIISNEWEKTDTQGALFIYSRNGEPFHSIMIVNRLNKDNFIEPIQKNFDYQMQIPFLLYRNSKNKIFGIWFFNREECIRITLLVESLMERFKEKSDGKSRRNNKTPISDEGSVDIFTMLTRAQEDFNKTPLKQDSLPPTFSSTPRVPDVTSQSVMDFFAKASTKSSQKPTVTGTSNDHVLHRLMSNPVHSVEHIEKQQRSVTPQDLNLPSTSGINIDRRSVPINFPTKNSVGDGKFEQFMENGFNIHNISPPQQSSNVGSAPSPFSFLMQNQVTSHEDPEPLLGVSPFSQFLESNSKPLLMTPMMFTTPDVSKSKMMHASDLENSGEAEEKIEMLTEKQLQQALIYLLKNNPDFIKIIHQAYVNSIMEKVNLRK